MATDYDAPRKTEEDQSEESIEELKARRHDKNSGKVDEDEAEAAESFELPGADLSHEELAVEVKPKQDDEFTCMSCFLVHHRIAAGGREEDDLPRLRLSGHARETQAHSGRTPRGSCGPSSACQRCADSALLAVRSAAPAAGGRWTGRSSWRRAAGPASGPARRTCR